MALAHGSARRASTGSRALPTPHRSKTSRSNHSDTSRRQRFTSEDRMKQYIIRRIGYCLLSLFLLSLTIFFFVRVTGDPATLLVEPGASEADIRAIHQQFGLDRPLIVQYWLFMTSLFQGDLGQSFYYQTPVMQLYLDRLPN